MKTVLSMTLCILVARVATAQNAAVFVADDGGALVADYKLQNAPALTNSCADDVLGNGKVRLFRVLVTQTEYQAGWAALAQAKKDAAKAAAENERSDMNAKLEAMTKALALVMLDEGNLTRQWLASFKTEVAAATTLADLKTRVASLPGMPDRTPTQLRDAVTAKYKALNP